MHGISWCLFLVVLVHGIKTLLRTTQKKKILHFDMSTENSKEKTWGKMFRGAGFRVQSHELEWANLTTHCQHLGVTLWFSPSCLSSLCHLSFSCSYLMLALMPLSHSFHQFTSPIQHKWCCRLGGKDQIAVSVGLVSSQEDNSRTKVSETEQVIALKRTLGWKGFLRSSVQTRILRLYNQEKESDTCLSWKWQDTWNQSLTQFHLTW